MKRLILALLDWGLRRGLSPLTTSFLVLGAPAYIAILGYLRLRSESVAASSSQVVSLLLALSWIWIGAASMYYHERTVLAEFRKGLAKILHRPDHVGDLVGVSRPAQTAVTAAWTVTVMISYWIVRPFMEAVFGFRGPTDPLYLLSVLGILYASLLSATGFAGALDAYGLVREACRRERLIVNPYDPDKLGGMSVFGNLTIRTTALLSTGALFVPALLMVTRQVAPSASLGVYVTIVFYSLAILLSFLAPNYLVARKARQEIAEDLWTVRDQLFQLSRKVLAGSDDPVVLAQYEGMRNYYLDLKGTDLFPFNARIMVSLASSVLLPLFFLLLEALVSHYWK